jgi:hypothetical protein
MEILPIQVFPGLLLFGFGHFEMWQPHVCKKVYRELL